MGSGIAFPYSFIVVLRSACLIRSLVIAMGVLDAPSQER